MPAPLFRTAARLGGLVGLVLLPGWAAACEVAAAHLIVRGDMAKAAALFATPSGPLTPEAAERVRQRLGQVASALKLQGQPAPLIRPANDDSAAVIRIGHEPRAGERLFYHRTVFLVDSPVAPGLRLAVLTTNDPEHCAVYAVVFEGRTGEARRALVAVQAER